MKILMLMTLLLLSACTATIEDYQQTQPEFKLNEFFNGSLKAYGVVIDYSGKVIRRFNVDMLGTWTNNTGVLDETFYYDDGTTEKRIWTLTDKGQGNYQGTADDVLGTANGKTNGFALNWHYTLKIPVENTIWHINFNDWMYLLDNKRLINRADMNKWGFKIGEVILWIEKQ
ncbi:MAG: DUF3833 domain-containing protein [Gammaproteobacteria bacterium]|nr:DUF3833 domain-containing protein [Gammaproteobacteria bacterium]